MDRPKIVAIKHQKLSLERKPAEQLIQATPQRISTGLPDRPNFLSPPPSLTELEKSLAQEIRKRGENLPEDFEEKLKQDESRERARKAREELEAKVRAEQERKELLESRKASEGQEIVSAQATEGERKEEKKEATETKEFEKEVEGKAIETKTEEKRETILPQIVSQEIAAKENTPAGEKQTTQTAVQEKAIEASVEKPKPKIVARNEYAPAAPARTSIVKVQEDIVREMRQQASKDILQVRKEIGRPVGATPARAISGQSAKEAEEIVRQIEEEAGPAARKQKAVDEAIRKFEQKEGDKSLVKRLMRRFGLK